jgi:phosphatidylserine/phosphatidylglycerophosphate/cardiolipin synthase-like enzyme
VATTRPERVEEALKLFQAEFDRKTYTPALDDFVVSPRNSRVVLQRLSESADKQLLIYDSRLTDNLMQRAIERRALAGVEVRVIGKVEKVLREVQVEKCPTERLHVRAMVVDGARAFVGSQSLRRAELERRREIGVVLDDRAVVEQVVRTFMSDWAETPASADMA